MAKQLLRHVGLSQEGTHQQLLLAQADAGAAVDVPVQVQPVTPPGLSDPSLLPRRRPQTTSPQKLGMVVVGSSLSKWQAGALHRQLVSTWLGVQWQQLTGCILPGRGPPRARLCAPSLPPWCTHSRRHPLGALRPCRVCLRPAAASQVSTYGAGQLGRGYRGGLLL